MRAGIPEDDYKFFDWHSAIVEAKAESGTLAEVSWLVCDDCHLAKSTTEETHCPYAADVHNDPTVECQLCKECYHERCMDI